MEQPNPTVLNLEELPQVQPRRLVALDAFRGLTMALMVLVNNSGGPAYAPLQHKKWNGWTITDTVFPTFVWIVGIAITLSLGKRLAAGDSKARLIGGIARRASILFAFGLLIYAYPEFQLSTQRYLGVLQRIAICYFAASLIYLYTEIRGQILWLLGLLATYWALMAFVPVPGFGAGRLDVEGNFAHWVDSLVLGQHNYQSTKTWDPEGIVSTIPAIATSLFGILCGHLLRLRRPLAEKTTWMFLTGALLLATGLILDIWLPINKSIWTSSFSVFMAGLDFTVLAGFVWLVDGVGYQRVMKPFVILGMNAIAVYMLSELLDETLSLLEWKAPIYGVFRGIANTTQNASLLYALSYTALMFLFAWFLYRRNWFWKV